MAMCPNGKVAYEMPSSGAASSYSLEKTGICRLLRWAGMVNKTKKGR